MTTENVTTIPQVPEIAHQVRESIVSTVKDHQQRALDAIHSLTEVTAKATDLFPTPKLPTVPGVTGLGDVTSASAFDDLKALTTDGYGLVQDLLTVQRDFALRLIESMTPSAA